MKEKRNSASLFGFFMQDLNLIGTDEESSDDDFRVEDHSENSDVSGSEASEEDSNDSDEKNDSSEDEQPKKSGKAKQQNSSCSPNITTEKLAEQTLTNSNITAKLLATPICCACLGDRSDDSNEIVECDGCKITVHEGCYGISDTVSVSSTISSCSTEPWFCEPCKANVKYPDCELCPNKGGIFKETDCGKWVHLVCALYVPGVAFGEVDQLSSVTLFEMQYNKWGAKTCSLCEDEHFARTGVCIGCDAGMCKTYFHVTW
jgi:PHD-zinc-finger like domain/PHD-finger